MVLSPLPEDGPGHDATARQGDVGVPGSVGVRRREHDLPTVTEVDLDGLGVVFVPGLPVELVAVESLSLTTDPVAVVGVSAGHEEGVEVAGVVPEAA